MRVGIGYDIHRFDTDRPLVLGGVALPGERGLAGHSDGDAVIHAIIDSILGAAGLGDIGTHFPPEEERFKGADSRALLTTVVDLAAGNGYKVENVDVTVIAEQPRLAPYVAAMCESIASAAGISPSQVSVKATSNEGLGALGRGEGIAAMAVALLVDADS